MPEDIEDREAHPWWKAKKWAYSNLNRLFVRYVFFIPYLSSLSDLHGP